MSTEEIENNITICDDILDLFAKLSDSDANEQDSWLLLGDLTSQTSELKMIYRQIRAKTL
jgi:hypothetical protein